MMFGERILMFLGAATLLLASQDIYVKADKVEIGEGKCNFTDTDTGDWRVEDCDEKKRPFQSKLLACVLCSTVEPRSNGFQGTNNFFLL